MPRAKKTAFVICLIIGWEAGTGYPVTADTLTYLALGDSYTIGQSVRDYDRYPAQVVHKFRGDGFYYTAPDIIAVTGWTTGDLLKAMPDTAPNPPYHVVSLLI